MDESLQVRRREVLINDLRRSALHLGMRYGGMPLYRVRLTRHDSPISMRRAYTIKQLRTPLQPTRIEFYEHYLLRVGAIAWKNPCP